MKQIHTIKNKFNNLNSRFDNYTRTINLGDYFKYFFGYLMLVIPLFLIGSMMFLIYYSKTLNTLINGEDFISKINTLIFYSCQHNSVSFILIIAALMIFFPKKVSVIIYSLIYCFFYVYAIAQYCVYITTGSMFRLSIISVMGEGLQFKEVVFQNFGWIKITLMILVLLLSIVCIIIYAKVTPKLEGKLYIATLPVLFLIIVLSSISIGTFKDELAANKDIDNSNFKYYTYDTLSDVEQAYKSSGIYHVFFRDIYLTLKSNITDDSQEQINEITAYLNQRSNHDANSMTGIFKGKNLIVVQMESMDYRVVNNQVCPNISKLRKESIDFSNFYTSRMGGATTFGTEFCINTGLYQPSGTNAATYFSENHFPYSLANLFKRLGYNAESFHYNDEYFYNRGKNHITLGFEKYNSFMNYTNDETAITFDDYLLKNQKLWSDFINNNELPFFSYLITYSAHVPYGLNDKIYLEALKRHPELNDESIDENLNIFRLKASITDDMVGNLVDKLDQENQLDNTVIIFITDHQAYGCNNTKLAQTDSRINNTPFFIYAKGFQSKKVEKVCNTSDVLPTICNLFDLDTDYKYLGHDIFDEEYDGYAYFPDLSWISNKAYYSKGNIIDQYTDNITNEEIKEMNDKIIEIIDINNKILFTDYYNN